MDTLSNIAARSDIAAQALSELATRLAGFLPNLAAAVVILLLGWALSRLLELAARRTLRTLGTDRVAVRYRLAERAGLRLAPSEALSKLLFWLFMIAFLMASAQQLGLTALTATVDRFISYIPNLIGAALTVLLGLLLARFLGSVASSTAAAAGMPSPARLGFLVQALSVGLVTIVAAEQLGLATEILVGPLTAILAAAAFSAGLALALGGRPVITHILAGHFLKQSLPRDSFVEIGGERGIVERIGATDTLLKNGDKKWSVPNAQLLEHVIVR